MNQSKLTLWQAIDLFVSQLPFSKEKLEASLGFPLLETSRNAHMAFFESPRAIDLADNGKIAMLDLRLSTDNKGAGFLLLALNGVSIGVDEVHARYPNLIVTDLPRGRSPQEVTTLTASLPWGTLAFGYRERIPDRLAYLTIDPE
ncbi:hypothetical protein [Ralstonia sp. SET104]|uniref:hypothetical protein n=1 Tax=Ralstonia sp. SET104 TaxID=2448774 RepID=UPI000F58D338|nr:hypothetical protein [Ralstonia sp. SET104]GCB02652.1 hypothetical protein PSUB009319_02830 [Ralstonia sp. SET104]